MSLHHMKITQICHSIDRPFVTTLLWQPVLVLFHISVYKVEFSFRICPPCECPNAYLFHVVILRLKEAKREQRDIARRPLYGQTTFETILCEVTLP